MPTELKAGRSNRAIKGIPEIQAEGIRETPTSKRASSTSSASSPGRGSAYALAIFVAAWIAADIVSAYVASVILSTQRDYRGSNSSQRSFPLR